MKEILIRSSFDGTLQPSLYFHPDGTTPVPLVVGLHTWSYDRFNQQENYLPLCKKYGWALLLPEFRGPNLETNPRHALACGSSAAIQDVLDAVHAVMHEIDRKNIFLLGCSGGGHMALLTAENSPELFRAVEVWCPVSNLCKWHKFLTGTNQPYSHDLETCLGGGPEEQASAYAERSPALHPEKLLSVTLSIHHGKHDEIVPYQHSTDFAAGLEKTGHSALYTDFFDGGHEQFPVHSFEHFARLAEQSDSAVRITG